MAVLSDMEPQKSFLWENMTN